jgi:hypothetical protein
VDGSGQSALNRFNRDVVLQPGVKWVIFSDDPINDLGSTSPPPTSAQLIAGLQQLISMAHQNGIEFICSTLTPYQGASYWTQQGETAREAYNAYVLGSGSGCDGVVDQAAATSNPSDPTMYLPAYDSGDHLHPNDAGYQAIANAVNLNLFGPAPTSSSLAATFNDVGISADNNTAPGNFDGEGASFSETALTNAGAGPGAPVSSSGVSFTFPNVAAGTSDNTVAEGQTIDMPGSGTLGLLVSASFGPATGTGTITYTDGSTQSYTLTAPDWWSTTAPAGGAVAVASAYQNQQGNTTSAHTGDIFSVPVTLAAGKTLASVTLPPGGALASGTPAIHVFAIATTGGGGAEAPYGGTAAVVPGTVQAANYDTGGQGVAYSVTSVNGTGNSYRSDGVDLEACTDTGCGDDLGWTGPGQWFKYTVNVAIAGTYTVGVRLASPSGVTDGLHVASSSGTNLSGSINVPATGGWQTWTTVTAAVALPAGQQTLTIDQDNGGWNIHQLTFASPAGAPYGGTAAAVPGTVQAANYDTGGQGTAYNVTSVNGTANSYRPDGVDLEATSDTGGGDDLGWTATGQWFNYTVNVATARSYTVTLRLASPSGVTDGLHIASSSGANLSGSINVPATGGWQTWTTVTATVALPAGQQTLTIDQDNGGWNIHQLTFA